MNHGRRRRQGIWRNLCGLLVTCCAILWSAAEALARAGGGGGYHGGGGGGGGGGHFSGGGGGSHGGGGTGDGVDIGWIIYVLFRYPHVSLPIIALVVLFFWYSSKYGNATYQSGVIRRGAGAMAAGDKAAALDHIRAHDPKFDEAALCTRVRLAFFKIQEAWCGQELAKVRPFISDGVYERFLLQIEEQRAEGYRDHMEDTQVTMIGIVAAGTSGLFDEASIRIAAVARDWRESLADGKRISGSAGAEPFVEIWTFLRRRGAVTDFSKSGLMEGNCPNCGAAVEMNQSARCTHCKAELRSGEYDWVLTEITQEIEWSVPRRDALVGVADLRQRDPGFDPASIEDRASVMYWRRATAERLGKIDPLRKVALPAFADAYANWLRDGQQQRPRRFTADCAVGSVQTLGVATDNDWDRAVVEIRWSGKRFLDYGPDGPRPAGEDLWASELFVLAKHSNVKTDAAKSISSAHCPNCGAPDSGGTSNACQFCGTVLNDGAHGWVLEQIASRDTADGRAVIESLAQARAPRPGDGSGPASSATPDAMGLLAWMVKIATADGNVDPYERQMLADVATHRNVPAEYVGSMITAGLRGDLQVPAPAEPQEAMVWLEAMSEAAWADGHLTAPELQLISTVGRRAGLSDPDVALIIRRARATVFNRVRANQRG